MRLLSLLLLFVMSTVLSGCAIFGSKDDKKIIYQTTTGAPPSLEIPPDLNRPATEESLPVPDVGGATGATYSEFKSHQKETAAKPSTAPRLETSKVRLERAGAQRWLVVQMDADKVWPLARSFFIKNGLSLEVENQASGLLETTWAENRAVLGDDIIYRMLSKVFPNLYSTGQKDKFRLRLERGQAPGTTEIYLSHRGMSEIVADETGSTLPTSTWQPRDPDPELENEMLRLLMAHIGVDEKDAKTLIAGGGGAERAQLRRDAKGRPVLSVADSLDQAWRRVGLSLDRVGFTVEDRDRSKAVYYVRYNDPNKESGKSSGIFSWILGDDDKKTANRYQVSLASAGNSTEVNVLNTNGEIEESKTGERILNLLYEQLK